MGLFDMLVITCLGFLAALLSGLVGIGGAVLVIPLLLYLPPLFGAVELNMKIVTGISTVHVLSASLIGALLHNKRGFTSKNLVLIMGFGILLGSFIGAEFSKFMEATTLKVIFANLLTIAFLMTVFSSPAEMDSSNVTTENTVVFNKVLAFLLSFATGLPAGMLGAGGAFILIPLMLSILKIPVRIAIGSSLPIVLLSAIAGFIGKASTGQIPFQGAVAIMFGAFLGSLIGAISSGYVSATSLRTILSFIICLVAIQMWSELLSSYISIAGSSWVISLILGSSLGATLLVVKVYRFLRFSDGGKKATTKSVRSTRNNK